MTFGGVRGFGVAAGVGSPILDTPGTFRAIPPPGTATQPRVSSSASPMFSSPGLSGLVGDDTSLLPLRHASTFRPMRALLLLLLLPRLRKSTSSRIRTSSSTSGTSHPLTLMPPPVRKLLARLTPTLASPAPAGPLMLPRRPGYPYVPASAEYRTDRLRDPRRADVEKLRADGERDVDACCS